MHKIFIDGQAGTTGLQIHERLTARADIALLEIDQEDRKNPAIKQDIIAAADVVVLCLPDDAAREAVNLARSPATAHRARFLDASTAHRTHPDWVYGLPEMQQTQRSTIAEARLVSNPGCYPTGFLTAMVPLVDAGMIDPTLPVTISAVSGYSGGGRQLIEKYEARARQGAAWPARPYALNLAHKHVPEMQHYARLPQAPLFLPLVGHFHQGMLVSTGLTRQHFKQRVTPEDVQTLLAETYEHEPCIKVQPVNAGIAWRMAIWTRNTPMAPTSLNSLSLVMMSRWPSWHGWTIWARGQPVPRFRI